MVRPYKLILSIVLLLAGCEINEVQILGNMEGPSTVNFFDLNLYVQQVDRLNNGTIVFATNDGQLGIKPPVGDVKTVPYEGPWAVEALENRSFVVEQYTGGRPSYDVYDDQLNLVSRVTSSATGISFDQGLLVYIDDRGNVISTFTTQRGNDSYTLPAGYYFKGSIAVTDDYIYVQVYTGGDHYLYQFDKSLQLVGQVPDDYRNTLMQGNGSKFFILNGVTSEYDVFNNVGNFVESIPKTNTSQYSYVLKDGNFLKQGDQLNNRVLVIASDINFDDVIWRQEIDHLAGFNPLPNGQIIVSTGYEVRFITPGY